LKQYWCLPSEPNGEFVWHMVAEVAAWNRARHAAEPTIDWRFTTAAAPIELTHLSPAIDP
jgi:hypothetical protein